MALINRYRWEFPLNSEEFIRVLNLLMAPGVYHGFEVVASSLPNNLDVLPGAALVHGALVENDGLLVKVAGVSPTGAGGPRTDFVVLDYEHGADPTANAPRIRVVPGDVNEGDPALSPTQVLIARIDMPPSTAVLTNNMITNVPRVARGAVGALEFLRPAYSGTEPADIPHRVSLTADGKALNSDPNLRVLHSKAPADLLLMNARAVLEGHYAGNCLVVHTLDAAGRPTATQITISDVSPAQTVNISYVYDEDHDWRLSSETLNLGSHTVEVSYTYGDAGSPHVPTSVAQVVTENV